MPCTFEYILSFSSAPCFLILQLPSLQNKPFWTDAPAGFYFAPDGPHWFSERDAQSETSPEDRLTLSCVAALNHAARAAERGICLVFMHR